MPLTPAKGAKNRITQLKSGDKVPDSEPRRYRNSSGYVRLRWRIAPLEQVEVYEHRVVNGYVTDAPEVHHRNRDRSDNRPENLVPLTSAEHGREHRRVSDERLLELYAKGLGTPEIGRIVGLDGAQVYRRIRETGAPMRSLAESQRKALDLDYIRVRHAQGVRARAIAKEMGVTGTAITARFQELGLKPFRTGRPPG